MNIMFDILTYIIYVMLDVLAHTMYVMFFFIIPLTQPWKYKSFKAYIKDLFEEE